jgi:hypothetical protein
MQSNSKERFLDFTMRQDAELSASGDVYRMSLRKTTEEQIKLMIQCR